MNNSWKPLKLGSIASIRTGKLDSNAAVENGKYPFFTCDPQTLRIDAWEYDTEALLLAGNNASGNYTAKYYKGRFNAYQRTYIIEALDENKLDVRFLCYAMNRELRNLKTMSSGSTTKFLTLRMLQDLPIRCPEIKEQKKIAHRLSKYDDLIENNRKQIKLLEEVAQRLYKEWFIDLRFPGYENTKIVDGVPEGWSVKPLSQIANVIMGQSPPSEYYNQDKLGLPFHQGVGSYGTRFVVDNIYTSMYSRQAEAGDILMSVRAPVGRINITRKAVAIGRGIAALCHKNKLQSLLLYMLESRFFKDNLIGNGSIFASVTKEQLLAQEFLVPKEEDGKRFNAFAKEIDNRIEMIDSQIGMLQEARDRLLMELLDGKRGKNHEDKKDTVG